MSGRGMAGIIADGWCATCLLVCVVYHTPKGKAMEALLIIVLTVVPLVLQLMAISVYSERMARALRRAADQPPFTTAVVIAELGPQPKAVARLLDRATRLDVDEVDSVIEMHGGRLPLLMSSPAAQRLVQQLRQLGATAEATYVGR